ncbi:MAG: arylesterase [Desulfobulbaceae bacterium]|nr:arylesterase [Desulfobulbaceae bacterium]
MKNCATRNLFNFLILAILWQLVFIPLIGCDRQEKTPAEAEKIIIPEYKGTIIAVGDSLTAGQGVAENDAWPALLGKKLHKNGYEWQVINAGISGETSSGVLSRVKWILAQKPEIVILETGANDGLRGIPTPVIRENIGKAVQMLGEGNVTVVLAGMQIVRNLGDEYTGNFAGIYPAVAERQKVLLIPFILQDVAGEPSLNQADTIHPNEMGHKKVADIVFPYVLQAIKEHAERKTADDV